MDETIDTLLRPVQGQSTTAIARSNALKYKRVKITDSRGRKSYPKYTQIDPILLSPYTLVVFLPNRAYLIEGTDLEGVADRFHDEAINAIRPFQSANQPNIDSITMHWLFSKTPEEFLREIERESDSNG